MQVLVNSKKYIKSSKDVDALVLPGGKWTPHDLRRTAATTMAELGALPDVVEKCLNHTEVGKVKRIYQRAQYEGPMRDACRSHSPIGGCDYYRRPSPYPQHR